MRGEGTHRFRLPAHRYAKAVSAPKAQHLARICFTRTAARAKTALMKTNPSSAEGGRLDNTPKWVHIQTCIITGSPT